MKEGSGILVTTSWPPKITAGGKDAGIDNVPDAGVDACGARRPAARTRESVQSGKRALAERPAHREACPTPDVQAHNGVIAEAGSDFHPVIIAVLAAGCGCRCRTPSPQAHRPHRPRAPTGLAGLRAHRPARPTRPPAWPAHAPTSPACLRADPAHRARQHLHPLQGARCTARTPRAGNSELFCDVRKPTAIMGWPDRASTPGRSGPILASMDSSAAGG